MSSASASGGRWRSRLAGVDRAPERAFDAARPMRTPSSKGGVAPLPGPVRGALEPLFGHDFSDVRIHNDASSHAQAARLDARAFTVGRDIHFGAGEYRPGDGGGLHLIAHELAHAIQQRAPSSDGVRRGGPDSGVLETEADVAADRISRGEVARVTPSATPAGVQRKPRRYSAKLDEGHSVVNENLAKYRGLYVRWRSELTEVIVAKCGAVADPLHDYRFVLMLAQRMVEQDGPREKAQGNNPYNVMGPGDPDVDRSELNQSGKDPEKHPYEFWRPDNYEIVKGERKKVPAWFAAYKTEMSGQRAFLVMLEKRWPKAYAAIASGASVDDYVDGLFPDKGKHPRGNFATASFDAYRNGVRLRARHVVGDLRRVYSAYLAEAQARLKTNPPSQPPPAVAGQPELDQLGVALITAEIQELDDLTDRIVEGKPVIRPAKDAATP